MVMKMRGTDKGLPKISTSTDVLNAIITYPNINTFEYKAVFTINPGVYEVTLVDTRVKRKYGSFLISSKSFRKMKEKFEGMVEFVEKEE